MGLYSQDVSLEGLDLDSSLKQLVLAQDADIVNITSFVSHDLARILFACSDAVLANSVHEPFGLVGLEAMAAGGTAFVGTTGEDYAHDLEDAVVLESHKAEEIVASILYLQKYSGFENQLRKQARSTAKEFTWERIIENKLLPKLERLEWESTV
jgi:glycosyltransferase involved in cell wall biosynthesis